MARKIIPASRTVGDRTFKLNENTRYSTTADNKPRTAARKPAGSRSTSSSGGRARTSRAAPASSSEPMRPNRVNNTTRTTGSTPQKPDPKPTTSSTPGISSPMPTKRPMGAGSTEPRRGSAPAAPRGERKLATAVGSAPDTLPMREKGFTFRGKTTYNARPSGGSRNTRARIPQQNAPYMTARGVGIDSSVPSSARKSPPAPKPVNTGSTRRINSNSSSPVTNRSAKRATGQTHMGFGNSPSAPMRPTSLPNTPGPKQPTKMKKRGFF